MFNKWRIFYNNRGVNWEFHHLQITQIQKAQHQPLEWEKKMVE